MILQPSCRLPLYTTEDPVDEASGVLGCVPLRECDRLVDRNLCRHVARFELVHRDAQRTPLDRTEAIGGPPVRRVRDALVERTRVLGNGLGDAARPGSISPAYCEPISCPERSHW